MVTVSGLKKAYGERILFEDAGLQINQGDRIGLVGPNGAGKSTFLSLMLGDLEPDAGEVSFQRNVTTGFLPQETIPIGDETVLDLAAAATPLLAELRSRMADQPHGNLSEEQIGLAHQEFQEAGGYDYEVRAKKMLAGLSFRQSDFLRPANEMSGGWVMRAHLARLLTQAPDLLMLDEPTNHLDLESLLWLQGFLKSYPGAILLISHDREFLNQLVSSVVEIRSSKLFQYRGNFDDYLLQKDAADAQQLAAFQNQQKEIQRLTRFVDRFRAKNTKATQAQSKLKQLDRMERLEAPESAAAKIKFSFPQAQRSGLKVITLDGVRHSYGNNVVYERLDFEAERGQRIVLVGPNGAGKSTLLKLLAGTLDVQHGERRLGYNVDLGFYSQHRIEMLQPHRTVLDEAMDTRNRITEQYARSILGCFLFRQDDVFKSVSVLSGGEKSRLALVKLLLDPPNLLLMDEPTTHLDMAGIEALMTALAQFQGTLIFISHDVHFIRAIAQHVVRVQSGQLTHYFGHYDYYCEKRNAQRIAAEEPSSPKAPLAPPAQTAPKSGPKSKEQRRLEAEERQSRSRILRRYRDAVSKIEDEITALEQRQSELTAELEKPETYDNPAHALKINREMNETVQRLESLTPEWEKAASQLAEVEGDGVVE